MKTLRLFILFILVSLQASATGYVHNMFVAHKKLQSGKELTAEKVVLKKVKVLMKAAKAPAQVKQAVVVKNTSVNAPATQVMTLNARILEEGPSALFESEEKENEGESMVSKLISAVRCVIYTFIPKMGR